MGRRRILDVESVLIYNFVNENGEYVPTKLSVNSWVKLQPGKHGGHAIDAKKHSAEGGYKARILKFRWKEGSTTNAEVLVQHVYMRRQLNLRPTVQHGGCNCKSFVPFYFMRISELATVQYVTLLLLFECRLIYIQF